MKPTKNNLAVYATNRLLLAAREYAARQWSIIPLKGKRAAVAWRQFQTRRPTQDELTKMFTMPGITGIGVVLGKISGGLACRDFDTIDAYQRWAVEHVELASALPTVKTARGYHVYFRLAEERFAELSNGEGELRGDSKHYAVLPPSRHPSGAVYTWKQVLP